jgi:pimeloyl-ACP methyl ester carboxylesterase
VRRRVRPALVALTATLACAPRAPAREALATTPCRLAHSGGAGSIEARCGSVEVPEDWARPQDRRIALRVAILPADAPRPRPDPVLVLAGGPGQAATLEFPAIAPAFAPLRRDRDVVLVDQRGTGGSARLACPPSPDGDALAPPGDEDLRAVTACARAQEGDPARYTTAAFARDLDHVRERLGRERVNLVGFSYGTRAALAYLRLFPDRVRTLVLDGVVPPDVAIGERSGDAAGRALSLLASRCAADPACRARFPDTPGRLAALAARLARAPARVELPDPLTGLPRAVPLGPAQLRRAVFLLSYAPETAALLPVLLDRAAAGSLAPLAAQALAVAGDVDAALSRPLQWSVLCAEDVPFYGPPPPDAAGLGADVRRGLEEVCRVWPHAGPDPAQRARFRSDVPALLLSGEADPVTPPSWAELAARDLPRARHLVLPGGGHGTLYRACLPRLVARFVGAASADGLDAGCVERTRPAPFFLDLLGPGP